MDNFVIPRDVNADVDVKGKGTLTFGIKSQSLTFADLCSLHLNEVIESKSKAELRLDEGNGCEHGPQCPQEVLMWRNFVKFCRAHDYDNDDNDHNCESDYDNEKVKREGNDLLNISHENQQIVDALMESIQRNGETISISSQSVI